MKKPKVQQFSLGDIYAADISDLDVQAESLQVLCSECQEADPQYILFASRLDQPEAIDPADPAFVNELRATLGMDFYFCACSRHVSGWGTFGLETKAVRMQTSHPGVTASLLFTKLNRNSVQVS